MKMPNLHPLTKKNIDNDRFKVHIKTNDKIQEPLIEGPLTIEMGRGMTCSSCKFTGVNDGNLKTDMGSQVRISVDGKPFWYGYVFKSEEDKDGLVEFVAYDQLRYLGFKDTYQYEDLTYSDLLKRICSDRNLVTGDIESSSYKIPMRIEEDKEYWEMLEVASKETTAQEGNVYALYDNAGKVCLKNIKSMKVGDFILNERTGQNYKYTISIDDNTYNRIKVDVVQEDEDEVKAVIEEDEGNIGKWGALQWYAQTTEPLDQVKTKAKQLLEVLNRPTKSFKVEGVFGNVNVRGGSLVPVKLKLRNMEIDGYMLVDSVTHIIDEGYHTMDMTLFNKDFMPLINTDNVFLYEKKQAEADGGTGGFDGMEGSSIQEQIWSFFKSKGFSDAAIAGIIGNISQESSFNPKAGGDGGTSFGLCQWHKGRWDNLKAYAKSKGTTDADIKTQLEFAYKELMAMPGGKDYMKMTDPAKAADWWCSYFERPDESLANRPNRRSEAEKYHSRLKNWKPSTNNVGGASGKRGRFIKEVLSREGMKYSQEERMTSYADDCSSLVLKAMRRAGLDTTGANMVTGTMPSDPRFYEIPWNQRQPGDILWRSGHVEVFMGGNKTFGAMDYGVPTGYSTNINRFNKVYRIKGL